MKVSLSPRQLRALHRSNHPNSHFFDEDTLKFYGERLSEMRVLNRTSQITDSSGVEHTCYVLSSLQRKHPMGPRRHYSYFDTETYEYI